MYHYVIEFDTDENPESVQTFIAAVLARRQASNLTIFAEEAGCE